MEWLDRTILHNTTALILTAYGMPVLGFGLGMAYNTMFFGLCSGALTLLLDDEHWESKKVYHVHIRRISSQADGRRR